MSEDYDNENENHSNIPYEEYIDENINVINWSETFLDNLISNPIMGQRINIKEEKNDNQTLFEFKKNIINKLYEEILLYFSSPELWKKFKSGLLDKEKNYEFYKDFDSEKFMIVQKERIKKISKLPKKKLYSRIKKRKFLEYKNLFFTYSSKMEDEYKTKFNEVNTLRTEMEKYSYLCLNEKMKKNYYYI